MFGDILKVMTENQPALYMSLARLPREITAGLGKGCHLCLEQYSITRHQLRQDRMIYQNRLELLRINEHAA